MWRCRFQWTKESQEANVTDEGLRGLLYLRQKLYDSRTCVVSSANTNALRELMLWSGNFVLEQNFQRKSLQLRYNLIAAFPDYAIKRGANHQFRY